MFGHIAALKSEGLPFLQNTLPPSFLCLCLSHLLAHSVASLSSIHGLSVVCYSLKSAFLLYFMTAMMQELLSNVHRVCYFGEAQGDILFSASGGISQLLL